MDSKIKAYSGTQAVLRAVSLLQVFSDEHPEWHLSDLSKTVNLNRTTTYRLLTALESTGLVERNPKTDNYQLGSEVIVLGGRALRAKPVRAIARPELEKLAALTGETATLEVLSGHDILIIDEVMGQHLMSGAQSIGTRWPAFATSTGKAIMTHLPKNELEAILQAPLPQITPKTITSPQLLHQHLKEAKANGYTVAAESLELGYVAIGVAICNYDKYPVAAISVGGPSFRLTQAEIPNIGDLLKKAAAHISAQLGYRP